MYTDIHTTAGAVTYIGVTAITKDWFLGASFAAGTHYILDFIMESKYKRDASLQVLFHVLYFTVGVTYGLLWEFTIGFILGNLFDIIDKRLGLSIVNLKKYPYWYHFHIKDQKVGLKISPGVTEGITVINIIGALILLLHIVYK